MIYSGMSIDTVQLTVPKINAGGPVLLEDYQNLEKISTFDRERIPERVVKLLTGCCRPHATLSRVTRFLFVVDLRPCCCFSIHAHICRCMPGEQPHEEFSRQDEAYGSMML